MKTELSEQTKLELERGRVIGMRKMRENHLARYVHAGKVKVLTALQGHALWEPRGQVNIFSVDGVVIGAQNVLDDDYPSEAIMAKIALAVAATVGTEGIPGPDYELTEQEKAAAARRNAYRDQHLGQWRERFDNKDVTANGNSRKRV